MSRKSVLFLACPRSAIETGRYKKISMEHRLCAPDVIATRWEMNFIIYFAAITVA